MQLWGLYGLVWLLLPGCAAAGAWPDAVGHGQLILKGEGEGAIVVLDGAGVAGPSPPVRSRGLSWYADYGLTSRLSLQVAGGYAQTTSGIRRGQGFSPSSAGLRGVLLKGDAWVASAYVGITVPASDPLVRQGSADAGCGAEVRLLAGRTGHLFGADVLIEAQWARRFTVLRADQTRLDLTLGVGLPGGVNSLTQVYSGHLNVGSVSADWVKLDQTLVRSFGPWSVQVGWRRTLAGRNLPAASGPIIGLWKRF